jgi:microcystin-dependent protein
MSNPYLGEIRAFSFGFAPKGWSMCNGQTIAISQFTALFSLLGTTYGGNGQTTFALPNLQGRAAVNWGQGPGLSNYDLGELTGTETVTLTSQQMPQHNHMWAADSAVGDAPSPLGNFLAGAKIPTNNVQLATYGAAGGATVPLAPTMLATTGNNVGHSNMQPFLVVNFCIAMVGIFPSRN